METTNTEPRIINDPGIYLALPVYNKVDVPFVECIHLLLSSVDFIKHIAWLPGDSLVSRARNNLAGQFLRGLDGTTEAGEKVLVQHDWMLFLDSDLVFRPESVTTLYELGKAKGPGIYCGTYPIKQLKPKVVFNNLPGHVPDANGIVKVREAGTGFMLIHRKVFEQMREKYREEIEFVADTGDQSNQLGWDFFSVGVRMDPDVKRKRFLSEDWYFCQRWREMGGDILMHTKIQCGHIGSYTFPGNPNTVLEAADVIRKAMQQTQPAAPKLTIKTVADEPAVAAVD